nr:hypothetical protein CFP56_46260 [Quercus suber]
MAEDLRRWDDECVEELCDIVFGQWMLGNFAIGVPREPLWDVITNTLNARTGKDFRKRQVAVCSESGDVAVCSESVEVGERVLLLWKGCEERKERANAGRACDRSVHLC